MSVAKDIEATKDIPEDVIFPPGDLLSDEPPLETDLHLRQMILLIKCLEWLWRDRSDFYAFSDRTRYHHKFRR